MRSPGKAYTPLRSFREDAVIVGVDEVGVGPAAGPIIACATAFHAAHTPIPGVTDSKLIPEHRRARLREVILDECLDAGFGCISAEEIDDMGIKTARKQVLIRALGDLVIEADHIYVDGDLYIPELSHTERVVKGDLRIWIVGAASILAKQEQCYWMKEVAQKGWPEYGFWKHHGYLTDQHRRALELHGVTPIHRKSFRPVKRLL